MPYVKGQSGNPKGRPKKEREERYYKITMSAVSFTEWREIVKEAATQAKAGDAQARKWLSDYLIGSPQQKLDITTAGEKISYSILDELSDAQRNEYFARLSLALSRSSGSVDLADTASQKE